MTSPIALVCNYGSSSIDLLYSAGGVITATSVGVGPTPNQAAQTPNGRYVYVANYGLGAGGSTVSAVSTTAASVVATISLAGGSAPDCIVVSPDGTTVYAGAYTTKVVYAISTATNTITASVGVPSGNPVALVISPDGQTLFVSLTNANRVALIATATMTVSYVTVGSNPGAMLFLNGQLWVVSEVGTVSVISGSSVVHTITVGSYPGSIVASTDGAHVYVSFPEGTTRNIAVISTSSYTVTAHISTGGSSFPNGMAIVGTTLVVTDESQDAIYICSTVSNTVTSTLPTPPNNLNDPLGVAITPDGTEALISNFGSNYLSVFNIATSTITSTVTVGSEPWFILPLVIKSTAWLRQFQRSDAQGVRQFQTGAAANSTQSVRNQSAGNNYT